MTQQIRINCRRRRKQLGLTQAEAAKRAGMTQPAWSDYECARAQSPRLETIRAVMRALDTARLDDVL